MSLTPQWLDELRARITLSSVIGRTTRLTKAGHEFKACCPFHNEKSPSFTVNDQKGFYHCFGCGAHGDAIRWMTDQRGLSFMDAVKELAAEAGLEVPAPDPRAARAAERATTLHDVTQAAQDWFVAQLASGEGARARAYVASRGFNARTVERFGFGFAPENRQAIKGALSRFPEDLLIEAGLRIAVDGKEPYDRFRGRLMLPIADARGRVIAFGGRILDSGASDAPKYLNSPDTPLFDKGRTLYNLHRAGPASRQSGRVIVVEGYMDVIALAAAGFDDAVAPLGTALTERQIEMLWRMVEAPILCFDGDAAGQRAAMRAVTRALPLLRPAHTLQICRLPAGLDPDDLIKRDGPAAMDRVLSGARTLVDTLWEHERDAAPLKTPEDKAGLKARLMAHVDTIADPDIKALYRRDLTERFSAFAFPARAAPVARPAPGRFAQRRQDVPAPSPENARRLQKATGTGARQALTAAVVAGLINFPAVLGRLGDTLGRAQIDDPDLKRILDGLLDLRDAGRPLEKSSIAHTLASQGLGPPDPQQYASLRFPFARAETPSDQAEPTLEAAIGLLVEGPELDAALRLATDRFDVDEQTRLRTRKATLEAQLKALARS